MPLCSLLKNEQLQYNDLFCAVGSASGRPDAVDTTDNQAPQLGLQGAEEVVHQPTVQNMVSEDGADRQVKRRKTDHLVNSESSVGNFPTDPTQPPLPAEMAIETPMDLEPAGVELMGGPAKPDVTDQPGPSEKVKRKGEKR